MKSAEPIYLTDRIALIDGYDMGIAERTGTYVINEEQLTLVETGPSPSIRYIKEGLSQLGHSLTDVKYLIVTHIHLDHAGGAGLFLQECPNAKLIVHEKGARHLIDPSRLIAGAKSVYGDRFSDLFDPIVAVPKDRIEVKGEGDQLQIGADCHLLFWNSPGHANHHLAIIDPVSKGIFTGDTAGIHYEQLAKEGIEFHLPSTSPNQFDPAIMRASILRMKNEGFDKAFFGHFGMTGNPETAFVQSLEWLDIFMAEANEAFSAGESEEDLAQRLIGQIRHTLSEMGIPDQHRVYELIELDAMVSSMGMFDYLRKKQA